MEYQQELMEALRPVLAFFNGISTIGKLIQLAVAILTFVSVWIVYNKAGQGGWKLLIPIYGDYIHFKIAHCTGRFWASLFLPVVSTVLIVIGLALSFGGENGTGLILLLLGLALVIVTAVIRITVPFKMAAAFNQSGFFGLGLWLLPTIFYAILAFNKSIVYGQRETIYGSL